MIDQLKTARQMLLNSGVDAYTDPQLRTAVSYLLDAEIQYQQRLEKAKANLIKALDQLSTQSSSSIEYKIRAKSDAIAQFLLEM